MEMMVMVVETTGEGIVKGREMWKMDMTSTDTLPSETSEIVHFCL